VIRLTARPPQLGDAVRVFNEGILTPNDAFFVRYHLTNSPPARELLLPDKFRLAILGKVKQPLTLSVADLKAQFEPAEVVAVNQCSGNGRGFFKPRVPGGQMSNGAMGNAKWKGARLADVLKRAGVARARGRCSSTGSTRPRCRRCGFSSRPSTSIRRSIPICCWPTR